MAHLTLDLSLCDVAGRPVVDPAVLVKLGPPDGVGTVTTTVALTGAPIRVVVPDGPAGPALILRVIPSLYRDGAVTCTVDGGGAVTPTRPLRLPRRPALWRASFTPWDSLAGPFRTLQDVLAASSAFRLGQVSAPARWSGSAFDGVDVADESAAFAKMSLLNLFARLREETAPGTGAPWFARVRELLLATRERFIAEVDESCWATVHDLGERERGGYRAAPVKLHIENFRAIPGVTAVSRAASVKTAERKANLQFSVAKVTRHGRETFLLDTDIDENGGLLLHTFDLIRHAFSGGTNPLDIHECLCVGFPGVDLGYDLVPAPLLPLPRVLLRRAALNVPSGARAGAPRGGAAAVVVVRKRAAKKR